MRLNKNNFLLQIIFYFLLINLCHGQSNTSVFHLNSTETTPQIVRIKELRIKQIPRGVRLMHPLRLLSKTEALTVHQKKFVPFSFWTKENKIGMALSEVAFVNWNAGGNNSISVNGNMDFKRNYKFRYILWKNELNLKFGVHAQEGRKLRKTDDALRVSSTFSYRKDTLNSWYYSAKANFRTQFSSGYKYPNRDDAISKFMAPGYLFLGAGTSYVPEGKKFNLYLSPFTFKSTFVLDQELANKGAFGVKKALYNSAGEIIKNGSTKYSEFGILITNTWETTLGKNVVLNHRANLYTDYLHSFGNIDVDFELNLNLKVNEYISSRIGTHLIYDDDIKFDEIIATDGSITQAGDTRIQFKQLLGVGIDYTF